MAKFKDGKMIGTPPEPQPESAPAIAQEAPPGLPAAQEAPKAADNGQTRQKGSQRTLHPELRAAQRVDAILADLTPQAAHRVLSWVIGWQEERESLARKVDSTFNDAVSVR